MFMMKDKNLTTTNRDKFVILDTELSLHNLDTELSLQDAPPAGSARPSVRRLPRLCPPKLRGRVEYFAEMRK